MVFSKKYLLPDDDAIASRACICTTVFENV